jgi:hypothetical protein
MKAEASQLYAAVRQSSATVDFPVSDPANTSQFSLSAVAGGYGDATVVGDAVAAATNRCTSQRLHVLFHLCLIPALHGLTNRFTNMETLDVWLAIQMYFATATAADSALLMYHAFSKMQVRRLSEIATTIDELLQVTLKTFSTEQFRAWEDCSSALAALGAFKDLLVLQLHGPKNESVDGSPRQGRSDSQGSDFQEIEAAKRSPGRPAAGSVSTPTAGRKMMRKSGDGSGVKALETHMQDVGLSDQTVSDAYVNAGRDTASGFRGTFFRAMPVDAYIAHHGRLSYYTTTRAEASGGAVDFAEHSIWSEAVVIVTYDRVMHLMHVPHDGLHGGDELKFTEEGRIMSVNIRNVLVRPFVIPKEGYRDAFEVLLAGSTSKKMSLLGSLSSSSKDVTAIIFLTHDSYQMRTWMRAISNPFVDTSRDPPDTPVPAAAPPAGPPAPPVAGSPARPSAPSTAGEGDGFSYSGEDAIAGGTNTLREMGQRGASVKLSSAPGTPMQEPSPSSALGGGDNFSGTNLLRTASFKINKPAAVSTAGATSAGGSADPDSFGGANLMRTASFKASPTGAASPMRGALSGPPTPVAPQDSTPTSAGGGGGSSVASSIDNFSGTNALRRIKKVPSAGGPQAGAANVFGAAHQASTATGVPQPAGEGAAGTQLAAVPEESTATDHASA